MSTENTGQVTDTVTEVASYLYDSFLDSIAPHPIGKFLHSNAHKYTARDISYASGIIKTIYENEKTEDIHANLLVTATFTYLMQLLSVSLAMSVGQEPTTELFEGGEDINVS